MMQRNPTKLRNSLIFVIAASCSAALVMFGISMILYNGSTTKTTIEQIQKNSVNQSAEDNGLISLDNLSASTIDNIEKSILETTASHNDDVDFNAAELTDSALGL